MQTKGMNPSTYIVEKVTWICKYWIDSENFGVDEAFAYNMSSRDKRQIRKIIYEHFEYIEQQWDEFQRRR